jgi:hypothetical protein
MPIVRGVRAGLTCRLRPNVRGPEDNACPMVCLRGES